MTGAAAQGPPAGPVDSLEVRWIVPGPLGTAVQVWFARFPARTEAREDAYLLWPCLDGLSVKLRDGSMLDVKSYLGSPGIIGGLPGGGEGRLESWRKWSFPSRAPRRADTAPPGWVTVRKARRTAWFPLPATRDQVPSGSPGPTGCMAELTEADVGGRKWWTVGLEATGVAGLLIDAVRHAAALLFAAPLPAGAGLSLGNSQSYAHWLHQQPSPDPGQQPEGLPAHSPSARIMPAGQRLDLDY